MNTLKRYLVLLAGTVALAATPLLATQAEAGLLDKALAAYSSALTALNPKGTTTPIPFAVDALKVAAPYNNVFVLAKKVFTKGTVTKSKYSEKIKTIMGVDTNAEALNAPQTFMDDLAYYLNDNASAAERLTTLNGLRNDERSARAAVFCKALLNNKAEELKNYLRMIEVQAYQKYINVKNKKLDAKNNKLLDRFLKELDAYDDALLFDMDHLKILLVTASELLQNPDYNADKIIADVSDITEINIAQINIAKVKNIEKFIADVSYYLGLDVYTSLSPELRLKTLKKASEFRAQLSARKLDDLQRFLEKAATREIAVTETDTQSQEVAIENVDQKKEVTDNLIITLLKERSYIQELYSSSADAQEWIKSILEETKFPLKDGTKTLSQEQLVAVLTTLWQNYQTCYGTTITTEGINTISNLRIIVAQNSRALKLDKNSAIQSLSKNIDREINQLRKDIISHVTMLLGEYKNALEKAQPVPFAMDELPEILNFIMDLDVLPLGTLNAADGKKIKSAIYDLTTQVQKITGIKINGKNNENVIPYVVEHITWLLDLGNDNENAQDNLNNLLVSIDEKTKDHNFGQYFSDEKLDQFIKYLKTQARIAQPRIAEPRVAELTTLLNNYSDALAKEQVPFIINKLQEIVENPEINTIINQVEEVTGIMISKAPDIKTLINMIKVFLLLGNNNEYAQTNLDMLQSDNADATSFRRYITTEKLKQLIAYLEKQAKEQKAVEEATKRKLPVAPITQAEVDRIMKLPAGQERRQAIYVFARSVDAQIAQQKKLLEILLITDYANGKNPESVFKKEVRLTILNAITESKGLPNAEVMIGLKKNPTQAEPKSPTNQTQSPTAPVDQSSIPTITVTPAKKTVRIDTSNNKVQSFDETVEANKVTGWKNAPTWPKQTANTEEKSPVAAAAGPIVIDQATVDAILAMPNTINSLTDELTGAKRRMAIYNFAEQVDSKNPQEVTLLKKLLKGDYASGKNPESLFAPYKTSQRTLDLLKQLLKQNGFAQTAEQMAGIEKA